MITPTSRTQLMNLQTADWDTVLLALFGIPKSKNLGDKTFKWIFVGYTRWFMHPPDGIPVMAMIGDSHAALRPRSGRHRLC